MKPATAQIRQTALAPLVLSSLCLLSLSCSKPGDSTPRSPQPSARPVVQTSNYPLTYFAQRIGGSHIEVQFQAPPDEDPAFWQPSADDIARFQSASLVLLNGATYEKWLDKVTIPGRSQVDTSASFSPAFIETKESTTHSHGKEGAHSHSGTAFTTWIDFSQAQQQAEAVRAALVKLAPAPAAAEEMNRNAAALLADLKELDASLQAVAQAIGNQPLAASHPVYQYLARRYQLQIQPLLWEPEVVPDEAALQNLKDLLAAHPARWMIWEGEPAAESVARLEALGVKSAIFDPCGNRPESGDWLSVMKQNIENLRAIR